MTPKIRNRSLETAQIETLESVNNSESKVKGNKHVNVLALKLLLSECSKPSPFILYFKSVNRVLMSKTVLPPLLHPISHQVAPDVKGVVICTECQQPPAGNILYHLSPYCWAFEFALQLYPWNGKGELI